MTKFLSLTCISLISATIFISSSAMFDQKSKSEQDLKGGAASSQQKKMVQRTRSLKALQEAMQSPIQNVSSQSQSSNGATASVEELHEISASSHLAKLMSDPRILKGLTTPLHLAAAQGLDATVRLLVDAGAKIDAKDDAGLMPLQVCLAARHAPAAKVLLEKQAGILGTDSTFKHALHAAAAAGDAEVVALLLNAGMEINRCDDKGCTPLHLAARNGHQEAVRLLLDAGADVHISDLAGQHALHAAAQEGHEEVVKHFLSKKDLEINKRDNKYCTALCLAARKYHIGVVMLLDCADADIDICDLAALARHQASVDYKESQAVKKSEAVCFELLRLSYEMRQRAKFRHPYRF